MAQLDLLSERLRIAIAARLTVGYEPDDPATGPYISPETVWEDALEADLSSFEDRLADAAELLRLDELSAQVLALCAAPQLNHRFGSVFGFLQGDTASTLPTPRLIASLLSGPELDRRDVLGCLAPDGILRRQGCIRLLDGEAGPPLAEQPIRLADPLTSFLLGVSLEEPLRDGRLTRRELPDYPVGRAEQVARIRAALGVSDAVPLLVTGTDAADVLAAAVELPLVLLDARAAEDPAIVSHADLIAVLEQRVVAFERVDLLSADERIVLGALIDGREGQTLLCGARSSAVAKLAELGAMVIDVPRPSLDDRRAIWTAAVGDATTEDVAAKFQLSGGQIRRAAGIARVEASTRGLDAPGQRELEAGARQASSSGLEECARSLSPTFSWPDLVLPERQLSQLRSISSYLRHREQVLAEWGYERVAGPRQGLKVLFAGESGTGKTMAAGVLANDLGLQLFAIDLATVVSKYVGETEQNLERIFTAAEGSNAILFFDEADALFGRRSDVADSRDRYANIEVAYLLQRMEAHSGAAILATNLKQNLDDAFLRRLDFVIDFPFPQAADRRRIWKLAIPDRAPVADDVDIDFLADRFKLSGGSIRNCSLAAAFEAAAASKPISMAHHVRAVAAEYAKLGRLAIEADFERFHAMLADPEALAEAEQPSHDEPETAADAAQPPPTAHIARVRVKSRIEEL